MDKTENIYLRMPLDRVLTDAVHGVSAAREALRQRDPYTANWLLGRVVESKQQKATK